MASRSKPPHLHAVGPGDAPAPRRRVHSKITDALEGSSRDVLAAMRRALAKKLDDGEVASNSIASAYKELRELDRLIRAIDSAEEADQDDGREQSGRRSFDASAI